MIWKKIYCILSIPRLKDDKHTTKMSTYYDGTT